MLYPIGHAYRLMEQLLDKLLESTAKARLLKLFLMSPEREFVMQEIVKQTQLKRRAIQKELAKLIRLGLVKTKVIKAAKAAKVVGATKVVRALRVARGSKVANVAKVKKRAQKKIRKVVRMKRKVAKVTKVTKVKGKRKM